MTKKKISATVDPDRLAEAVELTGSVNVSSIIDRALDALIDQERERQWLAAHPAADLPGEVAPDLSDAPWEET
jgi:post-segregation antitoxin (ccd killing protein)